MLVGDGNSIARVYLHHNDVLVWPRIMVPLQHSSFNSNPEEIISICGVIDNMGISDMNMIRQHEPQSHM